MVLQEGSTGDCWVHSAYMSWPELGLLDKGWSHRATVLYREECGGLGPAADSLRKSMAYVRCPERRVPAAERHCGRPSLVCAHAYACVHVCMCVCQLLAYPLLEGGPKPELGVLSYPGSSWPHAGVSTAHFFLLPSVAVLCTAPRRLYVQVGCLCGGLGLSPPLS